MTHDATTTFEGPLAKQRDARPAVYISAALGLLILFAVGFAQPSLLHNAAHDTRHAITFPCH